MPPTARKATRKTKPIEAKRLTLTPLDEDGQPSSSEPVSLPDASVTIGQFGEVMRGPVVGTLPRPTAVAATWWPCAVRIPGQPVIPLAKAFVTPQGLYVYDRRPSNVSHPSAPGFDPDGLDPANVRLFERINYHETPRPATGYVAMNAGNNVVCADGFVVNVTRLSGCGCNNGNLKRWSPSWARRHIKWEDLPR